MLHYAFSFFLSSLFIVVINIIYMQSYVYRDEELYHFDPQPYLREIEAGITRNEYNQVIIKPDLAERLENRGIGIQLINTDLFEVIRAGMVPDEIRMSYTLSQLVALYESDLVTTFVSETQSESIHYTVLMFLDPKQVKRMLYTYDVKRVGAAYNLSWLVGMNLILLLLISYIYTYSIIRPVHRIIERILTLAQGQYTSQEPVKGMYARVVRAMNQLATQLETARQQRALADAAQEEWIVNLSHDIKTPLTSMIGYAELLGDTDYKLETEERVLYKQYIQEKGRYIKALLSDLNLATRLKHHPHPLRLEQVNLIGVIKTELIKALNTSAIDNSRHTVAFTHSHEYVDVMLDLHLFERAFTNLIHNAFVHNEAPVSVKVHVDAHDAESISITIDDDGVGVKPEELHLIFTRYYRGTSTNTIREGSGLGLAIAKNIIEAHEGTIIPEKSPRGGLKITIYLRRLKNEKPS
jgi:signal transduction histidine kinase